MHYRSRFCTTCEKPRRFERSPFPARWGCLFTLLTTGLFLPVWLLIALVQTATQRFSCPHCGEQL